MNGYISPEAIQKLLDAAGISRAKELVIDSLDHIESAVGEVGFPLVMKVVGPVHKSDVGGVKLNIEDLSTARNEMIRMMDIPDATGILLQPMLSGTELFAGINKEDKFGHMILFGLGGIFIEVLKDVRAMLAPISKSEILLEMKNLASYKIIEGVRGMDPINEDKFAEIITRLSLLINHAPEIVEMDLNPLLGSKKDVVAVDARIRISKNN